MSSKTKYEIIQIDDVEVTVDVSMLVRDESLWFNATQMAKYFGKQVKDFLKTGPTKEYMEEIFKEDSNPIKSFDDIVIVKRGKYGGTFLHNEIAFEFAGWLSPTFRRKLHKWVEQKIKDEQSRNRARLEAKTGYFPLTEAIMNAHEDPKFYHYSNEADLLNRIVLGVSAKKFKEENEVDNVRDACAVAELKDLDDLQGMNTQLIKLGIGYHERKEILTKYHNGETCLLGGS